MKKAKKKRQRKRTNWPVDWPRARDIYIEGGVDPITGEIIRIPFAEVGRLVKASKSTISRKARDEGWERKRIKRAEEKKKESDARLLALAEGEDYEIPTLVESRKGAIQAADLTVRRYIEQMKAGDVEIKTNDAIAAAKFLVSQLEAVYGIEGAEASTAIIAEGIPWKEIILAGAKHLKDIEE